MHCMMTEFLGDWPKPTPLDPALWEGSTRGGGRLETRPWPWRGAAAASASPLEPSCSAPASSPSPVAVGSGHLQGAQPGCTPWEHPGRDGGSGGNLAERLSRGRRRRETFGRPLGIALSQTLEHPWFFILVGAGLGCFAPTQEEPL